MSGGFDLVRLEASCKRRNAARRIEIRDEVASTQDLAFELAEHGAPDGTVVAAGRQTKGRGRHGRTWSSVAGLGVEFSMVLRPPADPAPVPNLLVAATAVAAAEAVEATAGLVPGIRWPNDLVIGDLKLAGILVETRDFQPGAPLFVLGIGINAAHAAGDFPGEVRGEATSIALATGRVPDRTGLLGAVLEAVDRWRRTLEEGGAAVVEEAYRARVAYLGRPVRVLDGETPVEGVLESASPVAGLFLRLPEKKWRAIRPEHARDLRPA